MLEWRLISLIEHVVQNGEQAFFPSPSPKPKVNKNGLGESAHLAFTKQSKIGQAESPEVS